MLKFNPTLTLSSFKASSSKKRAPLPKLRSSFIFDKKIASSFANMEYYKAQGRDIKSSSLREAKKFQLRTPRYEHVSALLEHYKSKATTWKSPSGLFLQQIFEENLNAAKKGLPFPTHSNIMGYICNPETILLAYRKIRGNKGSLTKAGWPSKEIWNSLSKEKQTYLLMSKNFPDGISWASLELTCSLLKKGAYPWGITRDRKSVV